MEYTIVTQRAHAYVVNEKRKKQKRKEERKGKKMYEENVPRTLS